MSKEEEVFWVDLVSSLVPLMARIDIGFGPDRRRAAMISAWRPVGTKQWSYVPDDVRKAFEAREF